MKKSIIAIAFITLSSIACKTDEKKITTEEAVVEVIKDEDPINSYKVNLAESTVTWKGSKLTESHNGDIKINNGTFNIDNGTLKAGEFTIDMTSIVCLDLEGKKKAGLEGHLKNTDFFDVEKFSTAKFVITSSENKGDKANITGNLTIKDITKSITISAIIAENQDGSASLKSEIFSIDRTEFGVNYNSKKIEAIVKDKIINDLIEISFDIKAKK